MASRMNRLMRERGVIALGVAEAINARHVDVIARRDITSAAAAMHDVRLRHRKEPLGGFNARDVVIERRDGCVKMRGQAVDLLGVENCVALHEGDFGFNLRALLVGVGLRKRVGVNDKRAFFAFAYLPAKLGGLLVGEPERASVALLHRRRPKHQHIDAAIRNASGAQRARHRPGFVPGLPGLQPCEIAGLDVGDDFVGHPAVNVLFLGHFLRSLRGHEVQLLLHLCHVANAG